MFILQMRNKEDSRKNRLKVIQERLRDKKMEEINAKKKKTIEKNRKE